MRSRRSSSGGWVRYSCAMLADFVPNAVIFCSTAYSASGLNPERTMPQSAGLRCFRVRTMAHGDTFALGHAVEADCGALTIGGAAHAHRGAAAQGESRSGVRAVVNREIR